MINLEVFNPPSGPLALRYCLEEEENERKIKSGGVWEGGGKLREGNLRGNRKTMWAPLKIFSPKCGRKWREKRRVLGEFTQLSLKKVSIIMI